ncbi:hypothetical protein [Helcococcus ovis]|uniref:hypothetical protein n=1 Tax=Helcococcus ovis TaxID=72026 RepID=UPI0038BCDC21
MNYNRMFEWLYAFSEKILAYLINIFYTFILTLPLILVGLFIKGGNIIKFPILFIPLVTLYFMAIKSLTYAIYKIIFKNELYYKPFFLKSLRENFIKNYFYYFVAVSLLYFGLNSTYVMIVKVNTMFWILFALIIMMILPNIIYSTIQFALYETKSIRETINNSFLLSAMYGIITVAMVFIFIWIAYNFPKYPFKIIAIGIPIYSLILAYIHKLILSKLNKK